MYAGAGPRALLELFRQPGQMGLDQWEVVIQARIQLKADVYVRSSYLSDEQVRAAHLEPCHEIEETLAELLARYGPDARICVLPDGPQTIPFLTQIRGEAEPQG